MTTPPDPSELVAATPPQQPSATPEQAALLEWAEHHPAPATPAVPKNGNGQYHAPAPTGGKAKGHTRVTTYAGTLDDGAGLVVWRNRLLARGVAESDTIVAGIRKANGDKQRIGALAERALHEAGEKLKADIGTALHTAVEHAVHGTDAPPPPAPYDADQQAAIDALAAAGLEPRLVERCVYIPHGGNLIGRVDLMVAGPWGNELRICDTKTGSQAERLSTAIQLWLYAHATHQWTDGDEWGDLPAIDTGTAYVLHLPAGTGDATVLEVDLAPVGDAVAVCDTVRAWRRPKRATDLFTPAALAVGDASTTPPVGANDVGGAADDDRTAWMVGRIRNIPRGDLRGTLARRWPDTVPTTPPWTDTDIDALEPLVAALEPTFAAPDPTAPDPVAALQPATMPAQAAAGLEPDVAPTADAEAATVARWHTLTDAQKAAVSRWAGDAKRAGHPFNVGTADRTARHVACAAAAAACAAHLWDDDTPDELPRIVIAHITGRPVPPGTRLGGILGSLNSTEALAVQDLSDAFAASDPNVSALVGRLVQDAGNPADAHT